VLPAQNQPTDTDYDEFADDYAAENENGFFNAWYERPEMLRLAGDVDGLRVLDAGCGSGPLTQALRSAGATVSAFDSSSAMVDLARRRLGAEADLRVAELGAPLPFPDGAFDLVTASLVLHYLQDWTDALAELHRVLVPGGRALVSVNHPFGYRLTYTDADYFALTRYSEDYEMAGRTVWLTFWHRPLHAMVDAFEAAGLRVTTISEPPPAPGTPPELLPPMRGRTRFIGFLFFVLEAA
jgi:SAM-dependent methyltransferase